MNRFILLLTGLVWAHAVVAQVGTTVRATITRNNIHIGEHFSLRLEASIPEQEPIRFFKVDSIPHFEFLEVGKPDTINTVNGTAIRQEIRMTSWDSGHWVIPSFVLSGNIRTDTLPVEVGFSPFDPNQPYHDIKDIIPVDIEKKKKWWWYIAGGGALLLLLVIWLLLRKKKPASVKVVAELNPYEEAMKDLDDLKKTKHSPKQYYSRLSDIFRLYVYRKKGILSLQETTDDLVVQLKSLGLSRDQFDKLANSLRLGDFVKFARYVPGAEDDRETFDTIKRSITEIEQLK